MKNFKSTVLAIAIASMSFIAASYADQLSDAINANDTSNLSNLLKLKDVRRIGHEVVNAATLDHVNPYTLSIIIRSRPMAEDLNRALAALRELPTNSIRAEKIEILTNAGAQ